MFYHRRRLTYLVGLVLTEHPNPIPLNRNHYVPYVVL